MAELKVFKLPDVGEGLTEADILRWDVKPGDLVEVNQTLVEVETAKAAVELPSPFAGVIHEIHYAEGATVDVGQPIVTIKVGSGELADEVPPTGIPTEDLVPQPVAQPERQAVLVGYGVSGERARRRRHARPDAATPNANAAFGVTPGAHAEGRLESAERAAGESGAVRVLAKPPVRKLAKSLGIDLASVAATGPHGTVSRADVEQAASSSDQAGAIHPGHAVGRTGTGVGARAGASTGARAGAGAAETRIPIRGVRKHTAAAMVASAFTAPHVTEFVTVDVSETMALRDRVAARREFRDVKVSPLLFVARAVLWALGRTPVLNSTWDAQDGESGSIVIKHYVNLGIAAATDRGLIVPNVKSAESLSLLELAQALAALTSTARSGKTAPSDMSGGTFTITNVGIFGIDTGTPILNPGEAGILAVGAIRRQPWVVGSGADERIEPRWVTQLAVSFDHRSVDGQQGSLFLADVAALLNDPALAVL
ncbi:2-oxo acid dehydrogenase subunit E2 [Jatrophihabitans telluris]|uniref:Dihydrolipoamide acetyltransferase component of pyruvate dehydrogenase complex n=1 Tax=Jatrophihabitans telluris TaxID=2038343 RepID=A0ABY4QZ40_9ACTN|nr:dihydrolipoamide acetyltransferase family protein [Jatrophihabitans telluris]UQX88377.1 2-oxo acid dehydrogenase subunit E2 [Jatrophihabitans telluris]